MMGATIVDQKKLIAEMGMKRDIAQKAVWRDFVNHVQS
jgi:hypothetical protein